MDLKLLIFSLISFAHYSNALQCLTCNDCNKSGEKSMTCKSDQDVCLKIVVDGRTLKQCDIRNVCSLQKFQRLRPRLWHSLVGEDKEYNESNMACCSTNNCNVGWLNENNEDSENDNEADKLDENNKDSEPNGASKFMSSVYIIAVYFGLTVLQVA